MTCGKWKSVRMWLTESAGTAWQSRGGVPAEPPPSTQPVAGTALPAAHRLLRQLSLLEPEAPVGLVPQGTVVRDHQDGGAVMPAERADEFDDVVTGLLVQVARRLVFQDQRWLVGQSEGNGHPRRDGCAL